MTLQLSSATRGPGPGAWAAAAPHAIAVLGAVAVLAASGCINDRVLVRGDDGVHVADEAVVARFADETTARRGLPFARAVPLSVIDRAGLGTNLDAQAERTRLALVRQDLLYHRLGVLPPTIDSARAWRRLYGAFAGGLYDSAAVGGDDEPGVMLLVRDYAWWSFIQLELMGLVVGEDLAYSTFLVHELTHALQDQHLGLGALLDELPGAVPATHDVRAVRRAILESEANVMGMAHLFGLDTSVLLPRVAFFTLLGTNNMINGPLMMALAWRSPSFFARQAFSQYELGLAFVGGRLDAGEFSGTGPARELSIAWGRTPQSPGAIPTSTEQLLFPHKLLPGREDPPRALLPLPLFPADLPELPPAPVTPKTQDTTSPDVVGLDAAAQAFDSRPRRVARPLTAPPLPWARHVSGDTFGALALKHWLEDGNFTWMSQLAVEGWGGDRYDLFVDLDDDTGVLLWRLVGDSEEDARELYLTLREVLLKKAGPSLQLRHDQRDEALWARLPAQPDEERFIRAVRDEQWLLVRQRDRIVLATGLRDDEDDVARIHRFLWDTPWEEPPTATGLPAEGTTHADASAPEATTDVAETAPAGALVDPLLRLREATEGVAPLPRLLPVERFSLRHRSMLLGAGLQARFPDGIIAGPGATLFPVGEFRWGIRPWLELALPLGATFTWRGQAGFFSLGLRPIQLPWWDPWETRWRLRTDVTAAFALGTSGALVAQLSSTAQGVPRALSLDAGAARHDVGVAVGAQWRPLSGSLAPFLPGLVVQGGVGVGDVDRPLLPSPAATRVLAPRLLRVGAVLQRGFVDAPLVEVEIVPGLWLTGSAAVELGFEAAPLPALFLAETRGGLGVLVEL